MALANYKPVNIDNDEVLSRVQDNVVEAFGNLDQATATSVRTVTSQYTVTTSDEYVLADATRASFSVVLPDPSSFSGPVSIRRTDSSANTVTVQPASPSVKVDGSPSVKLATLAKAKVVSDGSNYWTVA